MAVSGLLLNLQNALFPEPETSGMDIYCLHAGLVYFGGQFIVKGVLLVI